MKLETNEEIDAYLNQFASDFLTLDKTAKKIALSINRLLSKGNPIGISDIKKNTGIDHSLIKSTLDSFPGVYYDESQQIIGFWGLAVQPMPHKIITSEATLYGWCAWDTIFIPELIGKDSLIKSQDPVTKRLIELQISQNGNLVSGSPNVVITLVEPPDKEQFNRDVINTFCHYVFFFESTETAKEWIKDHPNTFTIPLETALRLSKRKNELQFGKLLEEVVNS